MKYLFHYMKYLFPNFKFSRDRRACHSFDKKKPRQAGHRIFVQPATATALCQYCGAHYQLLHISKSLSLIVYLYRYIAKLVVWLYNM